MKSLKALVVRTAPVLVWLVGAAAVAAADRPSANTAGAGVGLLPVAPLFLPQHGYTGDLTLLGSTSKTTSLSQVGRLSLVESVSTDGKRPAPGAYRLRPGDHVTVSIFGEDNVGARNQRIDTQGNLALTGFLVGPMPLPIGGLSVAEAEAKIASYYRDKGKVAEPRVNIRIEVYAPLEVRGPQDKLSEQPLRLPPRRNRRAPPAPR